MISSSGVIGLVDLITSSIQSQSINSQQPHITNPTKKHSHNIGVMLKL